MTVPVQTTFNAYTANGATTVFPYGFKILAAADLQVLVNNVVTVTGFTVSGIGSGTGGNVTFTVAPVNGTVLTLRLVPILNRTVDFQQFGDWIAATVNNEFDRIWLALQAVFQNTSRSIKLREDTVTDQVITETAADRANKMIGFDTLGALKLFVMQTGTSLVNLAASSGSSLVGFIQSGTGAVTRTVQDKTREYVSVKDFGAMGDGALVAGVLTGTNDTAAFNLAIAYCGKTKILEIPAGMYIVTPGAVNPFKCSVYGPQATIIGSSYSADNWIVNLRYEGEYPITYGSGVTELNYWNSFNIYEIIGSPDNTKINNGVYCSALDQASIYIKVIRGCSKGIWLDGNTNNNHQGTNNIYISHLYECDIGILLHTPSTIGLFCESNRFTVEYMYGFTTAAISLAGGGTTVKVDNVFDIISCGPSYPGAHGIMLDANCNRNKFTIRSWDAGVTGAGKLIISDGSNNLFKIPTFNASQITFITGTNIFDCISDVNDGNGRSQLIANAVPSVGKYRVGDIAWNNAAASTSIPAWICTAAGTPGTWTPLALATTWAPWTPTVTAAVGTITTVGTIAVKYSVIGSTVFFSGSITITTNGTGSGSLSVTLPIANGATKAQGSGRESGVTGAALTCSIGPGATVMLIRKYDNSYPAVDGAIIEIGGFYSIT